MKKVIGTSTDSDDWPSEQAAFVWEKFGLFYDEETIQNALDTLKITEDDIKRAIV